MFQWLPFMTSLPECLRCSHKMSECKKIHRLILVLSKSILFPEFMYKCWTWTECFSLNNIKHCTGNSQNTFQDIWSHTADLHLKGFQVKSLTRAADNTSHDSVHFHIFTIQWDFLNAGGRTGEYLLHLITISFNKELKFPVIFKKRVQI